MHHQIGSITGKVYESSLEKPIEYANIILFNQTDSSQVSGTISTSDGTFTLKNIKAGRYYLEIRFMGYKIKNLNSIELTPTDMNVDMGLIPLEPTILTLEGLEVEGEKPAFTYEIDKKVINVDRMQTAASGTAVEVLENIPSVSVDIEGNVSLRGSSNFMLLIDGRPTILDANDALQQLPASTIDNIEIITNPSAKYDPEGTAGIINVILKKSSNWGTTGLLNMNAGMNDKYGTDLLLEKRYDRSKWIVGAYYSKHNYFGEGRSENHTTLNDITSFIASDGESNRGRNFYGLRFGYDYDFTPKNLLSISARLGKGSFGGNSDLNYDEWTSVNPLRSNYVSDEEQERSMNFMMANMNYIHKFATKGHEFNTNIQFHRRSGDETSLNELYGPGNELINGIETTEGGPSHSLRSRIDYTLPLGEDTRFEAGYQGDIRNSLEDAGFSEYDPDLGTYVSEEKYNHEADYYRNVQAIYTTYTGNLGKLGYQAGLRGEYTYRTMELVDENQQFTIDRWDYFPSTHFSYHFNDARQLMASYSRRIDRPRDYYLEPFITWSDAYNVRIGNPALKPEYIDSYELGYQTYFGSNLISTEVYYRKTNNKVERIRSVYDENVTLHSVENVGKDYSLGTEILFNFNLFKIWGINLIGNIYDYRIEGVLYDRPFSRSSFNWSNRLNNSLKLTRNTQIQLNGRYNSKRVTSQGESSDFITLDLALRQDFFDKQLTATLQIRDVLGTAKREFTSSGPDFYTYDYREGESPVVMLNLRYNINHYKPERKDQNGQGQDDMGEEDEF